ncbi:PDZ domain-containing protein [Synechococcus moorigangaii CMS01]|nr:PDZ domain-containing protein [Synechococcus moorigangaii CMS01]
MKKIALSLPFGSNVVVKGTLGTLSALLLLTVPNLTRPAIAAMEDSPKMLVDEMWQIVYTESVAKNFEPDAWVKLREELLSQDYATYEMAYRQIRGALRTLGDPYTRFLDPKEFETLTSQTTGELSGIGIRMEINADTGALTVVDVLPDSPAAAAGLQAADQIVQIDGQVTALLTLDQSSELIRGLEGTTVNLKIRRDNQALQDVVITREKIELATVNYQVQTIDAAKIGYIRLEEFSSHAAEQMHRAIQDLKTEGVTGFVLDLRGNPGGLLYSSVDIARMWMEEGAIVRTVDRKGGDRQFSANQTAITDLPLVVLVDENSASASEILAAALKDNKRATLVGTRTYGKGTVQSVHELSNGSGLAVTISRYYPPSGVSINLNGVKPDITVELNDEQFTQLRLNPSLVGTSADPQFLKAVNILQQNQRLSETITHDPPLSARSRNTVPN